MATQELSLSQTSAPYAEALAAHGQTPWQRLNVPGHGASPEAFAGLADLLGPAPMRTDVPPLIDGIDLGPDNPRAGALRLAAEAWGARRTWFLTNGASQGNRIATLALGLLGPRVVVQRSVHASVIDGLILSGLNAVFVHPGVDGDLGIAHGVTACDVDAALLAHPDAVAAYVVTPSYFGAVADVRALADTAHAAGVPLVVDEAWGAHLGFHPRLPQNALRLGADLVISSTHKLGGSLTQSAMLHLGHGPHAETLEPVLEEAFRLTQSTSESSLLLASLDLARRRLATGSEAIGRSVRASDLMRERIRDRGRFGVVSDDFGEFPDIVASDPLRVAVDTRTGGVPGHEARWRLQYEHNVLVEMATDSVVVAVVGAGAAPDVDRFVDALHGLPVGDVSAATGDRRLKLPVPGEVRMTPRQAFFAGSRSVPAAEAIGQVSASTLAAYPPGVPNVLPGEVITAELVDFLQGTAAAPGGHVRGAADHDVRTLRIVTPRRAGGGA
ncbi:aminotransferase class I/II-fold pyridoxal phosphate-dependent enzyme [Streptacidiphilus melanogenes]|uniref:aminotransferase class I/II-fold pyridoxal phosphate-dependent enzyme n=1 Tax=Streptacidiphilus melanogenes TaxID=411235 RepID=UPI0005A71376|nr:PLP-dependent transferase [Streptacidiphilus melanogenes]